VRSERNIKNRVVFRVFLFVLTSLYRKRKKLGGSVSKKFPFRIFGGISSSVVFITSYLLFFRYVHLVSCWVHPMWPLTLFAHLHFLWGCHVTLFLCWIAFILCGWKKCAERISFFFSFLFPRRLTSRSSEGGPEGSDFELEHLNVSSSSISFSFFQCVGSCVCVGGVS
jgi:hypothetical protein